MKKETFILDKGERILKKYDICDECLGRQFGQLITGLTNTQRGEAIRDYVRLFSKEKIKEYKNCQICGDFFKKTKEVVESIERETRDFEFKDILIGVVLPEDLMIKEEELWEYAGIDYCEGIKTNISRVIGKELKKKLNRKNPEMEIILDLQNNQIKLNIRSLFIYGKYNKYKEMPQTKWICLNCNGVGCSKCGNKGKLYETSVEEEIGKVILKETKGDGTKFHGAGREDIDALCYGWREFIIEIINPRKRTINLEKITKEINKNKAIEVKDLRFSNKKEVVNIKNKENSKEYEALVEVEGGIRKEDLEKIKSLNGVKINQQTPKRVSHRRADKIRKRKIENIKAEIKNEELILTITAQSGTYIKEFVSGDEGRTRPSVSSVLGKKTKVKKLKVIGFK